LLFLLHAAVTMLKTAGDAFGSALRHLSAKVQTLKQLLS